MNELNIASRLSPRARRMRPSPIRELFPYMSIEGMISLGGGYPNAGTFPFKSFEAVMKDDQSLHLNEKAVAEASQYGPTGVHPVLSEQLRDWHLFKDRVPLDEASLVPLNGAQEGLFIMGWLFVDDEDCVALSEPTYPGALAAFRPFTTRFLSIPLDAKGMDTQALDESLGAMARRGEKLPKFVYTIPNGHNPGGVCLAPERRRHLLEIAGKHDLLILEDDPYQLIRLDDSPPPPTLQSMDSEGRVIRLDSFSKIFAPGFRFGYASGRPEIMEKFVLFKQAVNLHTSSFAQALLSNCIDATGNKGFVDRVKDNCRFYRANRDAMVEAAREFLPPEISYETPGEGFFIWFRMPEKCSATGMIQNDCRALKVILVPGPGFSATGKLDHCMQASFATATSENIREGIKRFSVMFRNTLKH